MKDEECRVVIAQLGYKAEIFLACKFGRLTLKHPRDLIWIECSSDGDDLRVEDDQLSSSSGTRLRTSTFPI